MLMIIRQATTTDIPAMHRVRMAVKENALSNPALVKEEDYTAYLSQQGRGWVCTMDQIIIGFSIVDMFSHNVWALFVQPGHEGKGIGKKLHDEMLNWYFAQTKETIWLSTAAGTRAESFYLKAGWQQTGFTKSGEIKFEMRAEDWPQM